MDFMVPFYIVQCQFKISAYKHFTTLQKHQNYGRFTSRFACIYVSSHQNTGNTAINRLSCFYFTSWLAHIPLRLSTFISPMSKERLEDQESWAPFLPCPHSSLSSGLWQGGNANKEGYDRAPGSFVFLRTLSSFFHVGSQLLMQTKGLALGLPVHPDLSVRGHTLTPTLALGPCEIPLPMHSGPSEFHAQGCITNPTCRWLGKQQWRCQCLAIAPLLVYALLWPTGLHLISRTQR